MIDGNASVADKVGLVRYIVRYDRKRATGMVVLLALAGIFEGLGIAAVLPVVGSLISDGTNGDTGVGAFVTNLFLSVGLEPSIEILLFALVLMFALKATVFYMATLTVGTVVARVAMELRLRLLRAITDAEWRHVLNYPTGFISNAISHEASRTSAAYQEFAQIVADGMQVAVYLALALAVSWQTAVSAGVAGLIIMFILRNRVRASQRAGEDQVKILRSILARLTDAIPSLKPLKAMGKEHYLLPRLEEQTRQFFVAQRREIASRELLNHAREPMIILALGTGLWGAITLTSLSSASIMVLALLFYRALQSITNMQRNWVFVVVGESSFHSMLEHITTAENARESWLERPSAIAPKLKQRLDLVDVLFAYGDNVVIDGLDASLKAGQFVVLVGPSGSGKTTLVDLVTGLIQPTSGALLVDGTDLRDCDIRTWRQSIGYVPQEPMLFSDTILANVSLGAEGVSEEQVKSALLAADAWRFVQDLPGRLTERIGEGGITLSGGQRQRLAIARALVTNPSLLILDEPTTALDSTSEDEVCHAIESLKGRLTILAISHQPALRRVANEVWELKDGKINVLNLDDPPSPSQH